MHDAPGQGRLTRGNLTRFEERSTSGGLLDQGGM
jgi:hypothetical protein